MSIGWGHDTDGPNLWAASEYGFFSIRKPALAYEDVYKRMVDGITLYYTVMDIYEEEKESHKKRGAKKSRKRLDLNDVLLKVDFLCLLPSMPAALLTRHSMPLLLAMAL
jgi:hypothetical protein